MNTLKIIAILLFVERITGGYQTNFWTIIILFGMGVIYQFSWNLLKQGGWADAFRRESAAMYVKTVQKRETEKARKQTLKEAANDKFN